MSRDVSEAVLALERRGVLTAAQAGLFSRVARGDLVSVHGELRALAYSSVLLVMAGVGVLVQQNLDRIGPLMIASALLLGALASLAWVARHSPPFTWGEVPSPHLALDYVLLLAALLVGADLAYVEAKLTPLGEAWPYHLLIVAVLYALLAFRYDSRVVLSLALSSFAAWRGVSAGRLQHAFFLGSEDLVRVNAAGCGLVFLLAGAVLRARSWKAHFEPVATHLGWLLLLSSIASALGTSAGPVWGLVLLVIAAILATIAWRQRRFWLFALAILGVYVGLSGLVLRALPGHLVVWWFAVTPLMAAAVLFVAHAYLREPT